MKQQDWIGSTEARAPFSDIRSTREAVAAEKATLCLRLGELINRIPPKVKSGGSVNDVRHWRADMTACRKIAGNSRSSANELRSAISRMEAHWS